MNGTRLFKHHNSWSGILAAVALFILWGLELIFNELPREWALPNWVHAVNAFLLIATIILLPIILCIGWVKNFSRWSYPYVVNVPLYSLYRMGAATPGFLFGRESWGWRAWVPLAVVIVISLLITRSLRPLRLFFTHIWDDWTLLTFGLFSCMPILIAVVFDEIDRLYSLYFMVILTFLMAGTAYMYLQISNQRTRTCALLISIFLTITLAMAGSTLYWLEHGGTNIMAPVIGGIVIFLVMFSPALISLLHRSKR